jgi:hypothetical protein
MVEGVKTTIDIPEPLYRKAKVRAAQQGVTLREIVLAALEKDFDPSAGTPARSADEPHFEIDELGLPRLRRAKEDTTVVTEEFLNQLREQEGI